MTGNQQNGLSNYAHSMGGGQQAQGPFSDVIGALQGILQGSVQNSGAKFAQLRSFTAVEQAAYDAIRILQAANWNQAAQYSMLGSQQYQQKD